MNVNFLRISSAMPLEDVIGKMQPNFTINYTDDDKGEIFVFKIHEMDSYRKGSAWYVHYQEFGDSLGTTSGNEDLCGFENEYMHIGFARSLTLFRYYHNREEFIREMDFWMEKTSGKKYIPIEAFLKVIGDYEYVEANTIMNVTQITDTAIYEEKLQEYKRVSGED